MSVRPGTGAGCHRRGSEEDASPSCPLLLLPQAQGTPSADRAIAHPSPAAIVVTTGRPVVSVGERSWGSYDPAASSPLPLRPHPHTRPSESKAREKWHPP